MILRLTILLLFSLSYSQVPNYYNEIDFEKSPVEINTQLSDLIKQTHRVFYPYTSSSTDSWDILKISDEVETLKDDVYLIYGYDDTNTDTKDDYTRDKSLSCHVSGCSGLWNREHVFSRSLANPSLVTDEEGAGTDIHNLRACDGSMNSSRSNREFETGSGFSHITDNGNWYPGDEWKGDIARVIMYMYLRYDNQCLPNNIAQSSNTYHSDMPDLFLKWNAQDPVSVLEVQRNNVISSFQGNRNPFIDNPYLATLIWGGVEAEDRWNTLSKNYNYVEDLTIYPSYTEDTISITNNNSVDLNYSIFDLSGRLLDFNKLENNNVDVSYLDQGLYILILQEKKNKKVFKFLIK